MGELDVASAPLEATEVSPEEVPLAIDELTLVALLGACAEGETVVRGAEELRLKESDRIDGVVRGLRGLGAGGTFEGVALYAEWTTDESEWRVYERYWRNRPE